MTSAMENMVNDLTQHNAPLVPKTCASDNNVLRLRGSTDGTITHTPVLARSSYAERGGSISQQSPLLPSLTARDLVQQMRPLSGSLVAGRPAALPGIWSSPFTPRPGETPEPSPRPGTAHRWDTTAAATTGPPPPSQQQLNSSAQFQADLRHMQHQIQMRSSPPESSLQPTMSSSNFETPAHLKSWGGGRRPPADGRPRSGEAPWSYHSPAVSSSIPVQQERVVISTRSPDLSSPYGAIGEPRPKSSRATTSGRPG